MIMPKIVGALVRNLLDFAKANNAVRGPLLIEVERTLKIQKRWTILSRAWLPEEKSRLDEAEENLESVLEAYTASDQHPAKLKSLNVKVG